MLSWGPMSPRGIGMILLRIALWLVFSYGIVVLLAWYFQERLAFPAPRDRVPDPKAVGLARGERIELATPGGTRLVGWFLGPPGGQSDGRTAGREVPGLLWFYGNGETIGAIWPVIRDFQPPGVALLVVDYPGYGESGGRATEPALYEAGAAAYDALARRAGVDPARIYVYGRSLGAAVATHVAGRYPVAGLILESPFTSARDMARRHYPFLPRSILRVSLDNLAAIKRVRCPVLVFHGTADGIAPVEMGKQVAAAAPGPVELVLIEGAGHNETYDVGWKAYRDKLAAFVTGEGKAPRQ